MREKEEAAKASARCLGCEQGFDDVIKSVGKPS
jgi:hypothetical protein